MLSEASETALSIAGVIVRWVFVVWVSVAVILAARWILGFEFMMTAIRLGTYFTGALTIFWAGATALVSLNSYALTLRDGHFLQDFQVGVAATWLNGVFGALTLTALVAHFLLSTAAATHRAQDTGRNVTVGGTA